MIEMVQNLLILALWGSIVSLAVFAVRLLIKKGFNSLNNVLKNRKSLLRVTALTFIFVLGLGGCVATDPTAKESEEAGMETAEDPNDTDTETDVAESDQRNATQDIDDTKSDEAENGRTSKYINRSEKKKNKRLPWVYTISKDDEEAFNVGGIDFYSMSQVPYVNIDSEYAARVNREIGNLFFEWHDGIEKIMKDDGTFYYFDQNAPGDPFIEEGPMEYRYYISGNILSIVIFRRDPDYSSPYRAYNINLETAGEVSLEELYHACGFETLSELEDKVKIALYNDDQANLSGSPSWNNSIEGTYYVDNSGVFQILVPSCYARLTNLPVRKDVTYTDREVHIRAYLWNDKLVVEGKDYTNGNRLWSFESKEDIPRDPAGRYLGYIASNREKIYISDWSILYVLDAQTGEVINKDEAYLGTAEKYLFDDDGDLYVTSYQAPLIRFDENGKRICHTNALYDYNLDNNMWIELRIDGDKLIVEFDEGGSITFDKDTLEVISRDKEPDR